MAGRQARAPAPDGQQRYIERPALGQPLEEIGVPGEVDGRRSVDDVAKRGRSRGERPTAGSVFRVGGAHLNAAEIELVPGRNLENSAEPTPGHELAGSARDDHRQRVVELLERRE